MKRGENFNHPKVGSETKVEPVRSPKDLKLIKKLLADNVRDHALFTVGINTNLRASDLLRLTVGQVRHVKPMGDVEIREKKTGKKRRVTLNGACMEAIQRLLSNRPGAANSEPLFLSGRGSEALVVPSVNRLVKQWCREAKLKGNFGSHTLRKTWGYHQRVTFGVGLPELMVCFNHSTQRQTLEYLCVQPDEIRSVYANEL
jgi:integrase